MERWRERERIARGGSCGAAHADQRARQRQRHERREDLCERLALLRAQNGHGDAHLPPGARGCCSRRARGRCARAPARSARRALLRARACEYVRACNRTSVSETSSGVDPSGRISGWTGPRRRRPRWRWTAARARGARRRASAEARPWTPAGPTWPGRRSVARRE